ncbi:MAG: tetratricopeptide repeat protein [Proteobacteria bacterium]|nr:tetratricopeptide repeat protein [Pseudomonadota bacterium]
MPVDIRGLALITEGENAAQAFDGAVERYVKCKADAGNVLGAAIAADPGFAMAHCFKGYLLLQTCKVANLPAVAECIRLARSNERMITARERLHLEALEAWHQGEIERAILAWETILRNYPTDLLALRVAHFVYFALGHVQQMRDSILRTARAWGSGVPGYGAWLGMLAFGHEECGEYDAAERAGRHAVNFDAGDLWATHAVAHVMEMQGRTGEGIQWLCGLEPHWGDGGNFIHHLSWHRALFHLELGQTDAVLGLYDERVRNLDAALTRAQPDLYTDIMNGASLLWRLELAGVEVGGRWAELARHAEMRIGDHRHLLAVVHYAIALAADGREVACARLIQAIHAAAEADAPHSWVLRCVVARACEAAIAHRHGRHRRVVEQLSPIRDWLWRLGGSHAQRDLVDQMLTDSAIAIGRADVVSRQIVKASLGRSRSAAERAGYRRAARLVA